MAGRIPKDYAEFFSHDFDASSDEKILYLESKFGLIGYAFFFKMLELLARSSNNQIELNEINRGIFARKIGLSIDQFNEMLTEACRPEVCAFILEGNLLYSPGLKKRLLPLYEKRKRLQEAYEERKKSISAAEIPNSEAEMPISEAELTQRKEKKRKEKKSIEEYSALAPESQKETPSSELFEEFWTAYPNKRSRDRAENEWLNQRIDEELFQVIMDALEMHKKSRQWKDSAFIPFAHNWLRQRRYYDEVEPEAKAEEEFRYDNPINPCHIIDLESY